MKPFLTGLLLCCALWSTPASGVRAQQERNLRLTSDVSQLPERAKRFAVLIGVNAYDDPQVGALLGPANDMRILEEALVANAGFDPNRIVRLTNEQAEPALKPTRGNVLRSLSNALKAVPPDGLLLLAFSGHGTERNGRAFLLPADAQVNADIELLESTALEVATLKNMIRNRRRSPSEPITGVAQVVVLLDACRNDPTSGKDVSINPLTRAYDFNLRNSNVKAFVTLYATAIGARAYESRSRRQGYFISEVVAALKGSAANVVNERGEITLDRLLRHVEDEVPARVAFEIGNDQKPFAIIEGYKAADLVLAKAAAPVAITPPPRPTPTPPPVRLSVTGVPLVAMNFQTANVNTQGQIINQRTEQCWGFVDTLPGGVPLEMVELPAGEFWMGEDAAGAAEYERECERYVRDKAQCKEWANWATPRHRVQLKGFAMGKYEVTQRQWKAVMSGLPPNMSDLDAKFKGDDLPVVRVSWDEVQEFLKKLGNGYALPSEAEWEYAARAGTTTAFAFGPTINAAMVNYNGNYPHGQAAKGEYRERPLKVGSLPANAWGLFDLHGNVWEWCADDWHASYTNAPSDGRAWVNISARGSYQVLRGGSLVNSAVVCRSAIRFNYLPGDRNNYLGFRLVRR